MKKSSRMPNGACRAFASRCTTIELCLLSAPNVESSLQHSLEHQMLARARPAADGAIGSWSTFELVITSPTYQCGHDAPIRRVEVPSPRNPSTCCSGPARDRNSARPKVATCTPSFHLRTNRLSSVLFTHHSATWGLVHTPFSSS